MKIFYCHRSIAGAKSLYKGCRSQFSLVVILFSICTELLALLYFVLYIFPYMETNTVLLDLSRTVPQCNQIWRKDSAVFPDLQKSLLVHCTVLSDPAAEHCCTRNCRFKCAPRSAKHLTEKPGDQWQLIVHQATHRSQWQQKLLREKPLNQLKLMLLREKPKNRWQMMLLEEKPRKQW